MSTLKQLSSIVAVWFLPVCGTFGQGSLTPPGTPAPTMKTLSQVEPRTPISSLPFTINTPGSYYLTAHLTGVSGQNGIVVQADDVTIDLNGFALVGVGGSQKGIFVSSPRKNISVLNGGIRAWGGHGADLGDGSNCLVERLRLSDNGGDGLVAGASSMVNDCVISANTGNGLRVTGTGSRIEGNNLTSNGGVGLRVEAPGTLIVRNNGAYNAAGDYAIATGSSYGQIVQTPGPGFTNATPWANFSSSCPTGQIFCAGVCVNLANNAANCGNCGTVCTFANGTGVCSNSVCALGGCNAGFGNCDGNPANGCELNVASDPNNCGACNNVCTVGNGTAGCSAGICTVASCTSSFADCDGLYANGCEVNKLTDVSNCGACGNVCDDGLACTSDVCSAGVCNAITQAGFCKIAGQCFANGAVNPGNPCLKCNSAVNNANWSPSSAGTVCVAAFCSSSTTQSLADTCNGAGVCVDSGTQDCTPYTCNAANGNCRTTCTVNADCVSGYSCTGGVCTLNPLLTTARTGNGTGTVTSSPAGINCGVDCSESYASGTMVDLTASPSVGSTFSGWSGGGCSGTGGCTVTLSSATTVTATFTLNSYTLTTTRAGNGTGTVTSSPAGINCGVDCTESYNHGTMVTLTASPGGGSTFTGWSGSGCSGTGTCNVSITSAATVTATFTSP